MAGAIEKNAILVTGASRGLGFQIAQTLLQSDYSVIALSRSLSEELNRLSREFPERLRCVSFDLSQPQKIKPELIVKQIGLKTPLCGLVNNAAMAYDDIVTNLNLEPLEAMFRVNVFSAMELTKHAIRNMLLHRIGGSIVHVSSVSVHTGYKGLAMYAASKGAMEAFSKNTAREWGVRGIRSNCVVAGFMETEMTGQLTDEQKQRIYQRTALKRATSPVSVAETVKFLISPASESVTGQNFFVDGGTV